MNKNNKIINMLSLIIGLFVSYKIKLETLLAVSTDLYNTAQSYSSIYRFAHSMTYKSHPPL